MKTYNVYVQDKFFKTVTDINVGVILGKISKDIQENLVPDFDSTKDQNIKIIPVDQE